MNRKDTVTVFLRSVTSPYSIMDSARGVIDSLTFSGNFLFSNASSGTYLISIKHHNSIETWSKVNGIILLSDGYTYNYNFTTSSTQAYGNNLVAINSKWCIYSGDVDKNGSINLTDLTSIYNKTVTFSTGYQVTDLNADNIVNLSDLVIAYTNAVKFVMVKRP